MSRYRVAANGKTMWEGEAHTEGQALDFYAQDIGYKTFATIGQELMYTSEDAAEHQARVKAETTVTALRSYTYDPEEWEARN